MSSIQGMSAKEACKVLTAEHYEDAFRKKAEGRPVAWVTSIAPREFLEAMDIVTVYPENHAAAIAARRGSLELINKAEMMGYSSDICSYARVNLAYATDMGDSAGGALPKPDFLFCCNNICNTVTKWYEILAKRLNIPLISIDMPFSHSYQMEEHAIDYIVGQFEHAIKEIEKITGESFDYQRFNRVLELSNEASQLWKESAEMGSAKPCPFNGVDFFNYMALIVCLRGSQKAVDFFRLLKDEIAEQVKNETGYLENEKYRIIWDGIPFWFNLKAIAKGLKGYNAVMVGSTYPDNWVLTFDTNDIRSMARAYSGVFINRNFEYRVDNMKRLINLFDADGIIMHSNRSCKAQDFAQYSLAREITAQTGIPITLVDGDQDDSRAFSEAQFETRIQALYETIDQNKKSKRGGDKIV